MATNNTFGPWQSFTFPTDSTSDTLPMMPCPVCHELFNAGDQANRRDVLDADGDWVSDQILHTTCTPNDEKKPDFRVIEIDLGKIS